MPYRDAQDVWTALLAAARPQGGYVTARQAAAAGFAASHLSYHLRAGNLERVGHSGGPKSAPGQPSAVGSEGRGSPLPRHPR